MAEALDVVAAKLDELKSAVDRGASAEVVRERLAYVVPEFVTQAAAKSPNGQASTSSTEPATRPGLSGSKSALG